MPVNLTNTVDIVADSIHVKKDNKLIDVMDNINNIAGLPPETLNSLEKLAARWTMTRIFGKLSPPG